MNRLTRITSILIQLQSKRIVTAKEIAGRFEISLRTVYRDIKTLQEAGVPIGSENGLGYFIVDGYSLPLVMITEEEANALIVSEKLINNQGDISLKKKINSVLFKIKSVLKSSEKENRSILENRISPSYLSEAVESNSLSIIQKAIINTNALKISYHSIYKEETTQRTIEPLGVYYTKKTWIVIAYCQLRKDIRAYRLDKILSVSQSLYPFSRQHDFNLNTYFKEIKPPLVDIGLSSSQLDQ